MAKPNPLVLDGSEVKLRLQAERKASGKLVHIDWLRFTVLLRNVVPTFETLPDFRPNASTKWERFMNSVVYGSESYDWLSAEAQAIVIRSTLEGFERDHQDPTFQAVSSQAYDLAREVAKALGPDFTVDTNLKKGQDFYKWRFPIQRAGHECAWVGFLAASESPHADRQNQSIHVNIQGHACTFAAHGWRERMADVIECHKGKITRADLALDMFQGFGFDFAQLLQDYRDGAFNVRGKTPGSRTDGDWANGHGRSLYVGNRKSGKETNIYEKGDQLFGWQAYSPWVRAELRYGNQLRVLPVDLLRNPDDFFAGASDWHAQVLELAGKVVEPIPCQQEPKLAPQTVLAEVYRNFGWFKDSARQTVAAVFRFMDYDQIRQFIDPDHCELPGRLKKFKPSELQEAFSQVVGTFTTAESDAPRSLVAA